MRSVIARRVLCPVSLLPCLLVMTNPAQAQCIAQAAGPAVERQAEGAAAPASTEPAYCPDLKRVVAVAATKSGFESIAGRPRYGDFLDTTLSLPNWEDCSLYGRRTYTCDSHTVKTVAEVNRDLADIVRQIKICLGDDWAEDEERSSKKYIVLRNARGSAAMTLSTDQKHQQAHVVHLILFVR